MRAKPDYTWEWFESRAPFKKVFEKYCNLEIEHELRRIPTIAGCWSPNHHFKIKYDWTLFENNFEEIKQALLNTNICKNNKDVKEFVEEQTCDKRSFCSLVTHGCGCFKYSSGSFEWHNISK